MPEQLDSETETPELERSSSIIKSRLRRFWYYHRGVRIEGARFPISPTVLKNPYRKSCVLIRETGEVIWMADNELPPKVYWVDK